MENNAMNSKITPSSSTANPSATSESRSSSPASSAGTARVQPAIQAKPSSSSAQADKMVSEGAPAHSAPHLSAVAKTLEAGHDWIADVQGHTEEIEKTLQNYVKKNAIPAVLVAVGVGFFGSLLFKKISASNSERNHS